MRSSLLSIAIIALLGSPTLADKKKKGGDDAPPPPTETEKPAKKKNKDKAEEAPPPAPAPDAKKTKKKDEKKDAPAAEADKKKDATPPPAPSEPSKGTLKPGEGVGMRRCLGSSANLNIEATSKSTVGVATCRGALERMFVERGLCTNSKGKKLKYSWQFADTTGDYEFTCR